ncbi:unnamed protein product [Nippostrongylus brasiliensis]|uniref:Diacylglycerol kinase alpha (inferred by orthology to a human protein) n=1 Tax=Nippostrongylus brasiliensis TaxID=27835 RepID=A0A0N4YAM9_NIPBR|nr:unnamed protein product [Nippostrongylus brasiliensis]
MLLSPEQFSRLSEYASYSNHKLKDMLVEFQPDGKFYPYLQSDEQGNKTMNLEGFRAFLLEYFERRTSLLEEALSTVRAKFADNLSKLEKLTVGADLITLDKIPEEGTAELRVPSTTNGEVRIPLKPLICTLSLLEPDTPENKLEVVFHVYDSDANGFLDKTEIDGIIEQMMNVARHQQWDTIELEPEMKEDGSHSWRLRHFSKPTHCNACCSLLVGWGGKQGLSCSLCKYTVHERCVRSAASNCIRTFSNRQQGEFARSYRQVRQCASIK